jgi:hypothetical protein
LFNNTCTEEFLQGAHKVVAVSGPAITISGGTSSSNYDVTFLSKNYNAYGYTSIAATSCSFNGSCRISSVVFAIGLTADEKICFDLDNSNKCLSIGVINPEAAIVIAGPSGATFSGVGINLDMGAQLKIGPNVWLTDLEYGVVVGNNSRIIN